MFLLKLISFCCCFLYLLSLPTKKFDDDAEDYENKVVADTLIDKTYSSVLPGLKIQRLPKNNNTIGTRLKLLENPPTDSTVNFLNSIFNVGEKILKPFGIESSVQFVNQADRNGDENVEFRKEFNLFGIRGKNVDKLLLNGNPTLLTSKKLELFGTPVGSFASNKQMLIAPNETGYVNCNQLAILGSILNDCDAKTVDLSGITNILSRTAEAFNVLTQPQKSTKN